VESYLSHPRAEAMTQRILKTLTFVLLMTLLLDVEPANCEGWSLWNPFSSGTKSKKATWKTAKSTKKEPSALEKVGSGTKNLLDKTGETLGLKKPAPKKPQYAMPKTPLLQSQQKKEKSFLGSLSPFKSEEPKKPYKDVNDWMTKTQRIDPE
jgi:hypothetical protein